MDGENAGFLKSKNHRHNSGNPLHSILHKVHLHIVRPRVANCHNSYSHPGEHTRSFRPMNSIYAIFWFLLLLYLLTVESHHRGSSKYHHSRCLCN